MNDDDRHRRNHEEGIDERQDNRNHKDQQNKKSRHGKDAAIAGGADEPLVLKLQKTNVKKMNIMTQNTTNIKMIVI